MSPQTSLQKPAPTLYHQAHLKHKELAELALSEQDYKTAARQYGLAFDSVRRELEVAIDPVERERKSRFLQHYSSQIDRIAAVMLPQRVAAVDPQRPAKPRRPRPNTGTTIDDAVEDDDIIQPETPEIDYSSVSGMAEMKQKLTEAIMWPIMYPADFAELVCDNRSGAIMYGPPGCGKTYIAKAVAGEVAKLTEQIVKFYQVDSDRIKDKWYGNAEKNLKKAFQVAAKNEPCILFIDEVDDLGIARGSGSGGSDTSDKLVNTFLKSFELLKGKTVMVLAATNRPHVVDAALTRYERFDELVYIGPPDLEARTGLFKIYMDMRPHADDINYRALASMTEGYASSDIAKICKEAGMSTLRRKIGNVGKSDVGKVVTHQDVVQAVNKLGSSLYAWAFQVKRDMLDSRYSKLTLRSGVSAEFMPMIRDALRIEAILASKHNR